MPGGSTSAGSDVDLAGIGSCHVTLPPSKGGYFRLQFHYNDLCLRFQQTRNSFPTILNSNIVYSLKGTSIFCCQYKHHLHKVHYENWSSSVTKEEGKYLNKIPDKYTTCWLGYKKNPHKDRFQMTNHFRKVLISQR